MNNVSPNSSGLIPFLFTTNYYSNNPETAVNGGPIDPNTMMAFFLTSDPTVAFAHFSRDICGMVIAISMISSSRCRFQRCRSLGRSHCLAQELGLLALLGRRRTRPMTAVSASVVSARLSTQRAAQNVRPVEVLREIEFRVSSAGHRVVCDFESLKRGQACRLYLKHRCFVVYTCSPDVSHRQ